MIHIKLIGRHPKKSFGEWKSWEDKDICKEIVLHRRIKEPLCLDCQEFWDSWNSFQRGKAISVGNDELTRYWMEEDQEWVNLL